MRTLARSRLATIVAAVALASVGLGVPGAVRAATTVTFVPVADAQVYSSHLTTNYGSLTTLRTREGAGTSTDPTYRSYLRFDVAGVSGQVTAVTLRLSASDPSPNGQGVYAVAPGWTEAGITYGNAPSIGGTALGSAAVPSTGYNDIALAPSSVAGDGSIWLGIISAGTNSAIFDSREGAAPPLLVVTFGGTPPPPAKPVAAFSGTPRSGTAPLTVAFTDASTNGPTSWSWDFGDPSSGAQNSATVANPSHTYATAGTYTVTLTAANAAGSSAPLVKTDYVTATTTQPPGDAVLVGAGDIADCSRTQDSKTEALLAAIPGTVFAAGDLSYPDGTAAEFANCYGPTWGLEKARTRPVIGNHEYNTSGAAPYFAYWGAAAGDPSKGYYSYDIGGWHAVVLNSNCSKVGGCGTGSAQEKWLKADLAASTAACTIAFWHHARFSSSRTSPDNVTLALWQDLYAAGAEITVAGHYHNYERFAPQTPAGVADPATGIRQFVVGTGGTGLGGFKSTIMANSEVHERSTYGVLKLTLHASSYDFQFVPIAGQTFTDSGSASCHGRP